MSVFAPMLSSLWRQIEDYGIDPGPLFRKQGIVESAPFDPNTRVSAIRIDRVMVDAAERSGDQFFGLKEANYFLPSHIGPLGFAYFIVLSLQEQHYRELQLGLKFYPTLYSLLQFQLYPLDQQIFHIDIDHYQILHLDC